MKKSVFFSHLVDAAKYENRPIDDIVRFASALGYVGADVGWSNAEDLCKINAILKESNMKIAQVYRFLNLFVPVDTKDVHSFFDCLEKIGCNKAMIVPDGAKKDGSGFDAVCDNLNAICNIADEYGVTVTVEDFDSADVIISNTDSIKRAFEKVPKLRHTFDTGNYAYFNESATEAYKVFKDRIVHVHLKDRAFSPVEEGYPTTLADGTVAYPCALGDGCIEIEDILKTLLKDGYDGYITVEHFGIKDMKKATERSSKYLDKLILG